MRQHLQAAHPKHDQERETDQHFEQRLEETLNPHEVNVLLYVLTVQVFKTPQFGGLLNEGANHPHAGEILLDPAGDIGEHRLYALEARVDVAAKYHNGEADGGG